MMNKLSKVEVKPFPLLSVQRSFTVPEPFVAGIKDMLPELALVVALMTVMVSTPISVLTIRPLTNETLEESKRKPNCIMPISFGDLT